MKEIRKSAKSIVLLTGLILALFAGISIGVNADPIDPNGYVCSETNGVCDPNYNVTCCKWGPGGCEESAGAC